MICIRSVFVGEKEKGKCAWHGRCGHKGEKMAIIEGGYDHVPERIMIQSDVLRRSISAKLRNIDEQREEFIFINPAESS